MNYYNINTALFNYVSLRASSTVAFHPTVLTVGFPGLHFVMPSIVLRKYGLEKHYEMSFEPSRVPPASALKLIPAATASNWKQYIWYVDGDVTMLG